MKSLKIWRLSTKTRQEMKNDLLLKKMLNLAMIIWEMRVELPKLAKI
nr:MAG TPA: hypothetical protein [Bacteriophage sp.]